MNAAPLHRNVILNNIGSTQSSFCSSCGVTCTSDRDNKSQHDNFQRVAIGARRRLNAVANATKVAIRDVVVIKSVHEKFLSRERLYQIAHAHLRNSPPTLRDDCTNIYNCNKIRFRIALRSFRSARALLSQLFSSLFENLKINHLRRLPPDQVL